METAVKILAGLLISILLGISTWQLTETISQGKDIAIIKEQVGVLSGRLTRIEP